MLKPASFYAEQQIDLRLGVRAERIEASERRVHLSDGAVLNYDNLVVATGAHARALPMRGAGLNNVMSLRTLEDAQRIRAAIGPGKKLVIIGGGYVGLECAATARTLGAEVVVLERAPRLLERVASAQVSSCLHSIHQQHGVHIVVGADIVEIEGTERAEAVRLASGLRFECDLLLVGIGAVPCANLATDAGLACDDGVLVDDDCGTSDPHIFAIGDVARRTHPLYQRSLRIESVPNALEQARRVAATISGRAPAEPEVPWFWSDQYALKLQMAGLSFNAEETVVRGNPDEYKFAVFHLRDSRVVTVESINAPQEFMAGKKWIASGKTVDRSRLADTSVTLVELSR